MAQLPKPFQRPSIALGTPAREWLKIPATQLRPGDTVPDLGVIANMEVLQTWDPSGYMVLLTGVSGKKQEHKLPDYRDLPLILAFVVPR